MVSSDDDSRIILSIFNYCDRRCERCRFAERCSLFKDLRKSREQPDGRGPIEHIREKFQEVFTLLQQWCEREGIDLDEIQREANDEMAAAEAARRGGQVRADPLQELTMTYLEAAHKIVGTLSAAPEYCAWPRDVTEAIDTIAWHSTLISSKTYRALRGYANREEITSIEEDPSQSDWNGSAKVARIIVGESKDALFVVLRSDLTIDDAPLKELVAMLEHIDDGLAERFPRAMEFMRPGFDEPWLAGTVQS